MSSRNRSPRFARTRTVLVLLLAVVAVALFASAHREELREIVETLREGDPFSSSAQAAQEGEWLDSGPTRIDPQELAGLDIAEQDRSADDYDREDGFGRAWLDVDGNGCDTRSDILARDLAEFTYKSGSTCKIADGTLNDPYTGTVINGDLSENVQIDHVVSLADAWYSGASDWDAEQRERFANDPENLVAVDAATNMSKSDDSISEWYPRWDSPSQKAECRYGAQYVYVLATYELSVTGDDYLHLKQLEIDCRSLEEG